MPMLKLHPLAQKHSHENPRPIPPPPDEFSEWLIDLRARAETQGIYIEPLTEWEGLWINQPCLHWGR